jgi:hypothetical protein
MALPTTAPATTPAATPTPTAQPQQRASAGGAANRETAIDVAAASVRKVLFIVVVSCISRLSRPSPGRPPEQFSLPILNNFGRQNADDPAPGVRHHKCEPYAGLASPVWRTHQTRDPLNGAPYCRNDARGARHTVQRAPRRGRRPARLPSCLQTRPGRHRFEAARLGLCFWPLAALDQVEEPECTNGEA